jgi:hypothetical protein
MFSVLLVRVTWAEFSRFPELEKLSNESRKKMVARIYSTDY